MDEAVSDPPPQSPLTAPSPQLFSFAVSFCATALGIPVIASVFFHLCRFSHAAAAYAAFAAVSFVSYRGYSRAKYLLDARIQSLQEETNLLALQRDRDEKIQFALREKNERYHQLKEISRQMNESLDVAQVAGCLTSVAFALAGKSRGNCLFYLMDQRTNSLKLFKTRREDRRLVVKAKEGDIFDAWVMRRMMPLFVADTRRDFRFDAQQPPGKEHRAYASVISCPLVSAGRLLGIIRLDNPQPSFFSQDDLRFLSAVCDLGALALENSQLFERAEDLAIHDGLTSLYTKAYFLERLTEECKRANRQKSVFSLMMIDLDYFKKYNDTFGHTAGDFVLVTIAALLRDAVRGYQAVIGRFGGEEFSVILPGTGREDAFKLAQRLRLRIESHAFTLRRQAASVTISAGVAAFPVDAQQEDILIQKADKALYAAKSAGRNCVCRC